MSTEQKSNEDMEKLLEDFTLNESGIGDISEFEIKRRDEEIESSNRIILNQKMQIHAMTESIEALESQKRFYKQKIGNHEENIRNLQNELNDMGRELKQDRINHQLEIQALKASPPLQASPEKQETKSLPEAIIENIALLTRQKEQAEKKAQIYILKCKDLEEKLDKIQQQTSGSNFSRDIGSKNTSQEIEQGNPESEDIDNMESLRPQIINKQVIKELEKSLSKTGSSPKQIIFLNQLLFWAEARIDTLCENGDDRDY